MLKIPKTIKILGFDWTITHDQQTSDAGYAHGQTFTRTQRINLEPSMTDQHKEQVLIHEVLHALWWQQGLHERFKENKTLEEEVVTTMSNGLYQVLKENNLFNTK